MQALSVIIPGDYWDVQIYRGRLHLWTMSGELTTVQWDDLINRLALSAESTFASPIRPRSRRGSLLRTDQADASRSRVSPLGTAAVRLPS